MATYADLKPHHRLFMMGYPFSRYVITDNPCARLDKPISESKFALITTAGLRLPDDKPFGHDKLLGNADFRIIPNDADVQSLCEDHTSSTFDHSGVRQDKNLAFPLDRFRELETQGKIASLNHRHFSFMGSIINPRKLIDKTAPQIANLLKEDEVDAVFLIPV